MQSVGFVAFIIMLSIPVRGQAQSLSLDDYLSQVASKNIQFEASRLRLESANERRVEAGVAFSPTLSAEGSYADENMPAAVGNGDGTHSQSNRYSIGVNQQTRYGLKARAGYNIEKKDYLSKVAGNEVQDSYLNSVSVELTQSLWKNAFGRLTALEETLSLSGSKSEALLQNYKQLSLRVAAEMKYWQLAIARELSKHIKESVSRSSSLRDWQKKRVDQRLADDSDLLQAEASVKTKQRDLNDALDEERIVGLEFNMFRNREDDAVEESVVMPSIESLLKTAEATRTESKLDVEAAKYGLEASRAKYEMSREQYRPTLDLFANASLFGKDRTFGDAAEQSFSTDKPAYAVGLKFTMLLDQGTASNLRLAYAKDIKAAELEYDQKRRDDDLEWRKLVQDLGAAKRRLQENIELEKLQREKFENEQSRYKQGRSTSYQLFVFEQDLFTSQVNKVQLAATILSIRAQMKLFEGVN